MSVENIDSPTDSSEFHLPLSKTAYVCDRLREEIARGTLIPGKSLRQSEIAKRYGVSATPVREALRILEAEGAIRYSPNRGATVREMSAADIEDTYCLRATVEGLATELAVARLTDEEFARIRAIHEELQHLDDENAQNASLLNRQLHFAIYDAGSPVIATFIASIWALFPPRTTIWTNPTSVGSFVKEHADILQAIADKDAKRAGELMSAHILNAAAHRKAQLNNSAETA